uniref:Uncharacterized protein n=1 Tax=Oryza barthii TaxID=65489 RepID=A0A0D3ELN3_9ORYZ
MPVADRNAVSWTAAIGVLMRAGRANLYSSTTLKANMKGEYPRQDKKEGQAWVKAGASRLQEFGILGDIT